MVVTIILHEHAWTTLLDTAVAYGSLTVIQKLLNRFPTNLCHVNAVCIFPTRPVLHTACLGK